MINKEKVIKGLESHKNKGIGCLECPYVKYEEMTSWCIHGLHSDILTLLKEQENDTYALKILARQLQKKLSEKQNIVQCKDCKHYRFYGLDKYPTSECTIDHCENPDENWFCADGERETVYKGVS